MYLNICRPLVPNTRRIHDPVVSELDSATGTAIYSTITHQLRYRNFSTSITKSRHTLLIAFLLVGTSTRMEMSAVHHATQEREQPRPYIESRPLDQPSSSIRPALRARNRRECAIIAAALCVMLSSWGVLLLISALIARNVDEERGHDVAPEQAPKSDNSTTAGSIWSAAKLLLLAFFWAFPVYFGLQRLLRQGIQGMRALLGRYLPPLLPFRVRNRILGDNLQLRVETFCEVLNYTFLSLGAVLMWSVFTSYGWDALGWDACYHPSNGHHHIYLSAEDRRDLWAVFSESSAAAGWHFRTTTLMVSVGEWPLSGVGCAAMCLCLFGLPGLMVWAGPFRFVMVIRNCMLPLLGTYTASWFLAHAEGLFSVFTYGSDFEVRQTHGELMLYLLVLWTVTWAPVAVFCETGSCQETSR